MEVHLVDGTYELFRHHFAVPSHITAEGVEVAATRAVLASMLRMLEDGVTHIGIATDKVVESFRNEMFAGYKTGEGVPPDLFAQFPLMEAVLEAAGFKVFAMVEFEADDALASASSLAMTDPRVEKVFICSPDKDLAQCVTPNNQIVQLDRRRGLIYDWEGVVEKFGVSPKAIPDWLALVGDTADGIPGLPGWGAKSSSTVLSYYGHLEDIPASAEDWKIPVRNSTKLASTFNEYRKEVFLYRDLTTLDFSIPVIKNIDELLWTGPCDHVSDICKHLDASRLVEKVFELSDRC